MLVATLRKERGSMRLFIALELPEWVKGELWENAEFLRRHCSGGRFSPRENYHITLAFLGEQPEARIPDVIAAMDECAAEPVPVAFGGLGAFETGVLWRGIEGSGELNGLQQELTNQLRLRNFSLEERDFKPHLTLARRAVLQETIRLSDLSAQLSPLSFQADRMTLMRSELTHTGAVYTLIYEKLCCRRIDAFLPLEQTAHEIMFINDL